MLPIQGAQVQSLVRELDPTCCDKERRSQNSQINKYLNLKKKEQEERKSLRRNEELASWRYEDEAVFHGVGTECSEALELRRNVVFSRDPKKSFMDQAQDGG